MIISAIRSFFLTIFALLTVIAAGLTPDKARAEATFLAADQAFTLRTVVPTEPDQPVKLEWTIAPGYYLYRDRLEVTARPSGTLVPIERPPGEQKEDPNFGPMEVYHEGVVLAVPSRGARSLTVSWQGCAEAGLCYPPQTREVSLDPDNARSLPETPAASSPAAWTTALSGNDGDIQSLLQRSSLIWSIPLFFALGIALSFTPCVLPMIPILSSIVVGSRARPRRAFALSLAFVLPMAATYAALGIAAALAGANLQAWLQNPWALFGMGAVFVILAGGMFGFFTVQLPRRLQNSLDQASRRQKGGTLLGAAAMGFLSALLVGPCMTAPLAGTLLYIAQSGSALHGGLLLLSLGFGMGVPLLVIATVGARYLPRPGAWMDLVKGAFGFVLLGMAIWIVQRVIAPSVSLAMWGALLVAAAVAVFQLARGSDRRNSGLAASLLMGLWGAAMWLGAAAGASDPLKPLSFMSAARGVSDQTLRTATRFEGIDSAQALNSKLEAARVAGKPVLVDFYADWCISCKSIETEVFGDPEVQRALADVVLLRADVTDNTEAQRALMRGHEVIGPPTVMIFDAQGIERRDARLVGEFDSKDLIKRTTSPKVAL